MPEAIQQVGGEVDAQCTRCKMLLAHTILAMVGPKIARVRCNTCKGEHAFKKPPAVKVKKEPKAKVAKTAKAKRAAAKKVTTGADARANVDDYSTLITGKNTAAARAYSIKDKYSVGELVRHPTFGVGVVASARGVSKVDIAFPEGAKTLMHNKDAVPTEMARALPRMAAGGEQGSADAPPSEPMEEPAAP